MVMKLEKVIFFPLRISQNLRIEYMLSEKKVEIRNLMGGVCNEQQAFREILNGDILENVNWMAETTLFVGIYQNLKKENIHTISKKE